MPHRPRDAGFKSRKFVAYIVTTLAIAIVGLAVDVTMAREIVFGLVSVFGLFLGGNVSQSYVDQKHGEPRAQSWWTCNQEQSSFQSARTVSLSPHSNAPQKIRRIRRT